MALLGHVADSAPPQKSQDQIVECRHHALPLSQTLMTPVLPQSLIPAYFKRGVDDSVQLVGLRRDRFGRRQVCLLEPQERAQGAVRAVEPIGREAQGFGGPLGRELGPGG